MPIRIKHRDKNCASTQQPALPAGKAGRSVVVAESDLLSQGVSYGSHNHVLSIRRIDINNVRLHRKPVTGEIDYGTLR
jgi:hypothetical protein